MIQQTLKEKTVNQLKIYASIVIPVYNSEKCLPELVRQLLLVLKEKTQYFEIILVNDHSKDGSWEKIIELKKNTHQLKGINLRKNFGQDNAIMAGLNNASGEIVVIMDDDLQHAPHDIPLLLDKINAGYDVCYANFITKKQSWLKNIGSWFNGKIANIVIGKPNDIYLSPFKAIKREVVEEIIKYDGPYPYVDGLLFGITQNITQVMVEHQSRYEGKSNYTFLKSVGVWLRLAINFSVIPLRVATFLGFLFAGASFILAIIYLVQYFIGDKSPTGWASMIEIMLFYGGVQLIVTGIIGEYLGRLVLHNNKKPQFTISQIVDN